MKRTVLWLFPAYAGAALAAVFFGCSDSESLAPGGTPDAGVDAAADAAPDGSMDAGPATQGAGCLDTTPAGFPYKPGCCDYEVSLAAVSESGFSTPVLGPSPTPDHVHVSFAGDTASTFAVNWHSDQETLVSELLYGLDEASVAAAEGPGEGVTRILGHHMLYGSDYDGDKRTRVHEAHVCGLSASTRYYYKVGGPGAWSQVYDVATAPPLGAEEAFSFAVTGDSRTDPAIWAQVQAAVFGKGVDFQLFSGDAVVVGQSQSQWNAFFESTAGAFTVTDQLARAPFMVANGNHDALAINFVSQFAMPQQLSAGETDPEEWYSFDYGNAHFVFLNDTTSEDSETTTQRDWLDANLGAVDRAKTPWVFVTHHKGAYSCSTNHGSNVDLREAWQPLFDKHHVDIVWNGHDHDYERSKPIRGFKPGTTDAALAEAGPNGAPVAESGTVYIVAAGAGAPLYGVDTSCEHTHVIESTRNYVIVDIVGRSLKVRAYRLDGTELDAFDYAK